MITAHRKKTVLLISFYALFIIAYIQSIGTLYSKWILFDQSLSHGLLVIALVIFLYSERSKNIAFRKDNPILILISISFFSVLWMLSAAISIDIIEYISLVIILILTQFALYPLKDSYRVLPVILLLFFAIPIWDYLSPSLVDLSSLVVRALLFKTDITAYINGNNINFAFGTVIIADGCSGIRYLTMALVLSYYLILTSTITPKQIILTLCLSIALGLIVNWLRIYTLVLIAYHSKMQSSLVNDHEFYGWVLFFMVILPLFFLARKIPERSPSENKLISHRQLGTISPALCITLISGPALLFFIGHNIQKPHSKIDAINDFNSPNLSRVKHTSNKNNGDISGIHSQYQYKNNEHLSNISIRLHWQNKTGDDLVPYISGPYDKNSWNLNEQVENNPINGIYILQHKKTGSKKVQLDIYDVSNYKVDSYKKAKLYQLAAVFKPDNYSLIIKITSDCTSINCEQAITNVKESLEIIPAELLN